MKTLLTFYVLCVTASLCGCAGVGSEPASRYDKFTGTTVNSTMYNDLNNGVLDKLPFYFDMRQEINDHGTNYFLLIGGYQVAPGYGESLFVLADSNRLVFRTDHKFVKGQGYPMFFFNADPEALLTIATATNVEMRMMSVTGNNWDRKLATKNRKNFYDFAASYITTNLPPFSAAAVRTSPTRAGSPKGQ